MKLKDFLFSTFLIFFNFFFIKKKYLKAFKKILNFPVRHIQYKIRNTFSKKNLDLDKTNIKNKSFGYLFNKFGSDKAKKFMWGNKRIVGHNYSPFYEKYLKKYKKNKNLNILEIGSLHGSSAAAIYFYFLKPKIVCADASPFFIRYFSKNLRPIYIDTQSEKVIKKFSQYLNLKFDIIIDDGSHNIKDQMISLKCLFPYLKKSGTYIIEDLTQFKIVPNLNPDDKKKTTIDFLQSIKKKKNFFSSYFTKKEFFFLKKNVKNISFEKGNYVEKGVNISDIVFIQK